MIPKEIRSSSRVLEEVNILRKLDDDSKIFSQLILHFETNSANFLIMELCGPNLEVMAAFVDYKPFGQRFIFGIAIQLILAARILNSYSILHCNIKPSSIVSSDVDVTSDLSCCNVFQRIKIVGFDLAVMKPKELSMKFDKEDESKTWLARNTVDLSTIYGKSFPGCKKFASQNVLRTMVIDYMNLQDF